MQSLSELRENLHQWREATHARMEENRLGEGERPASPPDVAAPEPDAVERMLEAVWRHAVVELGLVEDEASKICGGGAMDDDRRVKRNIAIHASIAALEDDPYFSKRIARVGKFYRVLSATVLDAVGRVEAVPERRAISDKITRAARAEVAR